MNYGERERQYELAVDIYHVLVTEINALMPDRRSDGPVEFDQLNEIAAAYVRDRNNLHPDDTAGVQRVIDEYPILIRRIRESRGAV